MVYNGFPLCHFDIYMEGCSRKNTLYLFVILILMEHSSVSLCVWQKIFCILAKKTLDCRWHFMYPLQNLCSVCVLTKNKLVCPSPPSVSIAQNLSLISCRQISRKLLIKNLKQGVNIYIFPNCQYLKGVFLGFAILLLFKTLYRTLRLLFQIPYISDIPPHEHCHVRV